MPDQIVVAALYQFTPLNHLNHLKQTLYICCQKHCIKGTILIAPEGINGTVSGTRPSIDALKKHQEHHLKKPALSYKESFCTTQPFLRLKVKIKKAAAIPLILGKTKSVTVEAAHPKYDALTK